MFDCVKVVDEVPEVLSGDDVFLLNCKEPSPGRMLQKLINDGRSYTRITTNQDLVSLFSGGKM